MATEKQLINKMVTEVFNKDCRVEAKEVLSLCPDALKEFKEYYRKKSFNVCCLVIDKWKDHLVGEGAMKQKKKDQFGEWMKKL